ncbi:glycosyltransferase [Aquihabitans daechungensis]|uniref:glycosyltransferase n=1 Tax=Aquihabitans daechungensis TaxID=1052257 RepID=UPI003BA01775
MTASEVLTLVGLLLGFVLVSDLRRPRSNRESVPAAISVIIPARDEERSLPHLLESLARQTLQPREIIVVDDGSTDATAAIASAAGATVVAAPPLPDGWVGKPWACQNGADRAEGGVLVFLDADVVLAPDGLDRIVGSWQHEAPEGLLSVQPFHRTDEAYEQLSAYPNLVAMMASGAFAPGRRSWSPVAFGPCLVTSRSAHRAVGGHRAVAGEVIEDIHLARVYGAAGLPVHALAGGSAVSFRMYPGGLRQLVDGWTKNLAGGPRLVSGLPMLGAVAWIVASVVVASDLVRSLGAVVTTGEIDGTPLVLWAFASAQVAVLLRRIGRFAWWAAPAFPLLLAGFVALFLRSTFLRSIRRSVRWRDRSLTVRVR